MCQEKTRDGLSGVAARPVAATMEVLQCFGRCKQLERFQNMRLDHFKRIEIGSDTLMSVVWSVTATRGERAAPFTVT